MTVEDLLRWRIHAQHLVGTPLGGPRQVVEHLLAVQAQDFAPAQWSLGRRSSSDTAMVTAGFDAGEHLRTHVLRPTWHFVVPADLPWLLALTAPRVRQANAGQYRRHGLDAAVRERCAVVVVGALQDGPRTREQLGADLAAAGVELRGQALAHALMHVELSALVASGPVRDRQHAYALLDAPGAGAVRDRDVALVELAVRFFTGHGPCTEADLAGWATLTRADVRRAITLAGDRLERVSCEDRTFLVAAGSAPPPPTGEPVVHLLQAYDEHVQHASGLFDATGAARRAWEAGDAPYRALVAVDGAFAGWWGRTVRSEQVRVDVVLAAPLDARQREALAAEADRLGEHLGLAAVLAVRGP